MDNVLMSWFSGFLSFFSLEDHCIVGYSIFWKMKGISCIQKYSVYCVQYTYYILQSVHHTIWSVTYSFPFLGHIFQEPLLSIDLGSVSEECKGHSLSLLAFATKKKEVKHSRLYTKETVRTISAQSTEHFSSTNDRKPISGLKCNMVRQESMQAKMSEFHQSTYQKI